MLKTIIIPIKDIYMYIFDNFINKSSIFFQEFPETCLGWSKMSLLITVRKKNSVLAQNCLKLIATSAV